MKIELLYVPACPHVEAAATRLREVLSREGVAAEVHEIVVEDVRSAQALHFRGSPTIRINGRDIEGQAPRVESAALACRLYVDSDERGVPPIEMIRLAVAEARDKEAQ